MKYRCPSCGEPIDYGQTQAGTTVPCGRCLRPVQLPNAGRAEGPEGLGEIAEQAPCRSVSKQEDESQGTANRGSARFQDPLETADRQRPYTALSIVSTLILIFVPLLLLVGWALALAEGKSIPMMFGATAGCLPILALALLIDLAIDVAQDLRASRLYLAQLVRRTSPPSREDR